MKNIFTQSYILIITFVILLVNQTNAQKGKILYKKVDDLIIEYERSDQRWDVVELQGDEFRASGVNADSAEIIVTYTGFTEEAKAAFQKAIDTWAALITTEVPIRISANWQPLQPGVLGSAGFTGLFANFENAPKLDTWYVLPLAEKLARRDLNGSNEADITANFNSTADWFFGGEDTLDAGETDLTSVVLHEICHGLGFRALVDVDDDGVGSYLIPATSGESFPDEYTTHIENGADTPLTNLTDNSTSAGDFLTSDDVFFDGFFTNETLGVEPKLFAPTEWDEGSSISHLDNQFNDGQHRLMTPSIAPGEIVGSPGIALQMLQDMGWVYTFINHEALKDTEDFNSPRTISASITSDLDVDSSSFNLIYTFSNFDFADTLQMMPTGNGNFSAEIPAPNEEAVISYYLTITDVKSRIFTSPGQAPEFFHQYFAQPDTIDPEITHSPISFILETDTSVNVSTVASDNLGLDSVLVEYKINNIDQDPFLMEKDTSTTLENRYIGAFKFPEGSIQVGDEIQYRVIATDSSSNNNRSISPETGFYTFPVEAVAETLTVYENDFNTPSNDFLGESFSVEIPSGFSTAALHSPHPYENAGSNNEIDFITQLRFPILLNQDSAFMQFREIVLVEPGDPGTLFGDENFWDYVIVEGSKDGGKTWQHFLDGYDSRADTDWLQRYNSGISGQDSEALGTPDLYEIRTIDMLENGFFNGGDEVLIRFRLFSDPFAFGWGWAIDDLVIQGDLLVTGIEEIITEDNIRIYPNPSRDGIFNLEAKFLKPVNKIKIDITGIMGNIISSKIITNNELQLKEEINITDNPAGLYLINIQLQEGNIVRKIIKAN